MPVSDDLLISLLSQTSKERKEQTASFERALGGLRADVRVFGVLMLCGILALSGVNVAINSGALSFSKGDAPATVAAEPAALSLDVPEVTAPPATVPVTLGPDTVIP